MAAENFTEKSEHRHEEGFKELPILKITCSHNYNQIKCQCHLNDLEHFYSNYLIPNLPCIINKQITERWTSVEKWVDAVGKPNFDYLEDNFSAANVPVADCNIRYYNSQQKCEMKMKDYIHHWKKSVTGGHDNKILYLKDWHFTRDFPYYNAYETPQFFESDWLNEFWNLRKDEHDDYRFVYMGPKNSWTPLHVDVYHSYSWSANICGKKLWILFPPEEENNLKDNLGNLPFDIFSPELTDCSKYPNYRNVTVKYRVTQQPGEIIFVPSGWIHQVHNLEDTISINHNWFNGCNINVVWQSLLMSLKSVQQEIIDCKDMDNWDEQCQLITRATYGMDVKEFWTLIKTVTKSKLEIIRLQNNVILLPPNFDCRTTTREDEPNFDMWWKHAVTLYELSKIQQILSEIIKDDSLKNLLPCAEILQLRDAVGLAVQNPCCTNIPSFLNICNRFR